MELASSILSAKASILVFKLLLLSDSLAKSFSRFLSLEPSPNQLDKPPKVTVSRILPTPSKSEPPICSTNFPVRIFFKIPLTALRIVSITFATNEPIPSFNISRIDNIADMICPMYPPDCNLSANFETDLFKVFPKSSLDNPSTVLVSPDIKPLNDPPLNSFNPDATSFNPSSVPCELSLYSTPLALTVLTISSEVFFALSYIAFAESNV